LQYVANVETHLLGDKVFVSSVDNVKGERGVMGWYYEINHKPAKTLAINATLKNNDVITWIYREDICSKTVDKCNIPTK
jgi:hypothetical protein